MARVFGTPHDFDEVLFHQRYQDACAVLAAKRLDVCLGDRLLVGDYSKGLHSRCRERDFLLLTDESAGVIGVNRIGAHLVTAGDRYHLHCMVNIFNVNLLVNAWRVNKKEKK